MIEIKTNVYIYRLEQVSVNNHCVLKIFDHDYNLISTKIISVEQLRNFLETTK